MNITCNHCGHKHDFLAVTIRSPKIILCPHCIKDMRTPAPPKEKKKEKKRK